MIELHNVSLYKGNNELLKNIYMNSEKDEIFIVNGDNKSIRGLFMVLAGYESHYSGDVQVMDFPKNTQVKNKKY